MLCPNCNIELERTSFVETSKSQDHRYSGYWSYGIGLFQCQKCKYAKLSYSSDGRQMG
jgi:hypothetical protein